MDGGLGQSSVLWADSLTNISIGGLLSEASLLGKSDTNAGLQPTQPISDLFDAYYTTHTNCPQGPWLSTQDSHSSILDAEETCHAFPSKKFTSSGKDVLPLSGSAFTGDCSQAVRSKSSKFPKAQVCSILFSCSILLLQILKFLCGLNMQLKSLQVQ
jgi:hypothetical protein